jgi:hypothetical protein
MDSELRSDRRTGRERLLRVGLLALAVPEAVTGLWALVSPNSFYRDFPGLGHHWLVGLGAFNEHLTVDFGATSLPLAALVLTAAVVLEPTLVRVALGCWLVWAIPHLAYHLTTPEHLAVGDDAANPAVLATDVVLPLVLLLVSVPSGPPGPAGERLR